MKAIIGLMLVVMLFASCERQSGKRVGSPTIKTEVKSVQSDRATVISEPECILVNETAYRFKTKVMLLSDSTVVYVILNNEFAIGDKVRVTTKNMLVN